MKFKLTVVPNGHCPCLLMCLCRTQLACCNHHDEYSDSSYGYKSGSSKDLLQELHSVGVCSYSEEYFTKAIKYEGSDTTKIGVFSVNW